MIVDMQAQFERAREIVSHPHAKKEEIISAEDVFHAALNIEPDNAMALFYAAVAASKRQHSSLAKILYAESAKCAKTPLHKIAPLNNLAILAKTDGDKRAAEKIYRQILEECFPTDIDSRPELKTERAEVLLNLGTCFVSNGTPQLALDILQEAEKDLGDDPKLQWNQALALLEKGDFEAGFKLYRQGDDRPNKRGYPDEPTIWNGEPGKKVIVIGEQGIGDEIMFASCIPDMMEVCSEVIFDCHERLAEIFRNSFGIKCYGTREQNNLRWYEPNVDHKIAIGDLPYFFRKSRKNCPGTAYLKADENLNELLPKINEDEICYGISWRGGTRQSNKASRTLTIEQFLPVLNATKGKKVRWVSLQYHEGAKKEVEEYNKTAEVRIEHYPEIMKDYDLTAALVAKLKLIVSVPQSVVHLAGALGVKTLQLNPIESMWQAGVYGDPIMPWYKSVTNLWQKNSGTWDDVMEETVNILESESC